MHKSEELAHLNPFGGDVCMRLANFACQGKMIRGALVFLAHSMWSEEQTQAESDVGAAMELMQTALLIHDDIMDRDSTRRGHATIHFQYAERAKEQTLTDALHVGESMGICAGDVAIFLAFELLSNINADEGVRREVLRLCAREMAQVGIAQMQDVYWGGAAAAVDEEKILRLYLHKTGRYTFSLPLMLGGILAGQTQNVISTLEQIGEHMGIAFQIRDDELGLFGDEQRLGKPIGSDVREGKKTLYHAQLFTRASEEQRSRLRGIFGNDGVTQTDIEYVRAMVVDLGIREQVQRLAQELAEKARSEVLELQCRNRTRRDILLDIMDYAILRTS